MAVNCKEYNFSEIESYWQTFWEENNTFQAADFSDSEKVYNLSMFPYPSGDGLHLGHSENYTAPDILSRYEKSRGRNVLQPMGWDAFGLPTEQYAIQTGVHPRETTEKNKALFRSQLKRHGFALDWSREIDTTQPDYYKWTQWIFLQMFRKGLAYVDEKPVWWCPALGTVLANEEVVDGLSERGRHPVERRNLRQWVLRITAYADRLLEGLDKLDWPESTKRQQEAWIGRSEGAEIIFPIEDFPEEELKVFTTRPDTLFGATYMVLSPEHPLVSKLTVSQKEEAVGEYVKQAARKSDLDRTDLAKEKTGVFTGSHALNPLHGERIPIWIADYVLMSYGTGAIMGVPAHDERDFEFAEQFELPIVPVIAEQGIGSDAAKKTELPYIGDGVMINSGAYSGMDSRRGGRKITADLEKSNRGKAAVHFKLRDWLFSRQRYWGEPFPIAWVGEKDYEKARSLLAGKISGLMPEKAVTYEEGGKSFFALPLPEDQLPLLLPDTDSFQPSGNGESPLANIIDWLEIWFNYETGDTLSRGGEKPDGEHWAAARRETNTMPQWAGSCWYHLRYCDPRNEEALIGKELEQYWKTPDLYIGGVEHAVLHLLYARFWHYFLYDIGVVSSPEPYQRLFHQGIILGEDGEKMSKSRGNVVNPDKTIARFGADSLRLFTMFMGPLQDMKPWSSQGAEGSFRFLRRVWREYIDREGAIAKKIVPSEEENPETERLLHETIKKVTVDIEQLRFNTAISQMMIFSNHIRKAPRITRSTAKKFIQILAPFAPHIAEEIWERLGEESSIANAPWPEYDPSELIAETVKIIFQVNGKYRGDAVVSRSADQEKVYAIAVSHPKVIPHLKGKTVRKVVFVPEKILNIVAL